MIKTLTHMCVSLGASYGILNQAAAATFAGSFDNRAELTETDFGCIPPLRTYHI